MAEEIMLSSEGVAEFVVTASRECGGENKLWPVIGGDHQESKHPLISLTFQEIRGLLRNRRDAMLCQFILIVIILIVRFIVNSIEEMGFKRSSFIKTISIAQ